MRLVWVALAGCVIQRKTKNLPARGEFWNQKQRDSRNSPHDIRESNDDRSRERDDGELNMLSLKLCIHEEVYKDI